MIPVTYIPLGKNFSTIQELYEWINMIITDDHPADHKYVDSQWRRGVCVCGWIEERTPTQHCKCKLRSHGSEATNLLTKALQEVQKMNVEDVQYFEQYILWVVAHMLELETDQSNELKAEFTAQVTHLNIRIL